MAKNITNHGKTIEALKHDEARSRNISNAEFQSVIEKEKRSRATIQPMKDVRNRLH